MCVELSAEWLNHSGSSSRGSVARTSTCSQKPPVETQKVFNFKIPFFDLKTETLIELLHPASWGS